MAPPDSFRDDVPARLGLGPSIMERTLAWLAQPGCRLIALDDPGYPEALRHISNPPPALFVQGRHELLSAPAFAIVGARNASPQGIRDAEALARALSDAGLVIVSGLALGIDAAAHRGGLAGAASSIAVMGTGPDILYPRRNEGLAQALAGKGCLVTEFPAGMPPLPGNFPRRNRLISGLSRGVLVVEAAMSSGSLGTARYAGEQGREVFAIPGSIHSPVTKGCHWLIKEGAKLVEDVDDVLAELGMQRAVPAANSVPEESREADPVLGAMGHAPMTIDELAMHTGLGAATLAARLMRLEVGGCVDALPGGRFQRARRREIE